MPLPTHNTGFRARLPEYFYTLDHPKRWTDEFSSPDTGEERLVLTPEEIRLKYRRDKAYKGWIARHKLRPKNMKFQRIRVTQDKYADSTSRDWWPQFYGAIFTVWMNPETFKENRQIMQYYILCPEDCELVQRYFWELKNPPLPPRGLGELVTRDPRLTTALVIPTRCAHHLRNETAGGQMEYAKFL